MTAHSSAKSFVRSNEKEISHALASKDNTAGVREREDANRTREAGNRDEVEGVVANMLKFFRQWAVGFIDWLGLFAVIGV
jgi:hypothetical protein